jgi:hypothetical protein
MSDRIILSVVFGITLLFVAGEIVVAWLQSACQ